jgi:hypothetical protein
LLLVLAGTFLALKIKKQNGLGAWRNTSKISYAKPLAIGRAWWLLTVRKDRGFGYVVSIGLPITNHQSLLTSHGRASGPAAADLR